MGLGAPFIGLSVDGNDTELIRFVRVPPPPPLLALRLPPRRIISKSSSPSLPIAMPTSDEGGPPPSTPVGLEADMRGRRWRPARTDTDAEEERAGPPDAVSELTADTLPLSVVAPPAASQIETVGMVVALDGSIDVPTSRFSSPIAPTAGERDVDSAG